ncbi:MAG: hypothetical protein C0467_25295 [Planctomycetaceae bacterium]|nr:hypothetical protein [Planctomycetaceae bacterium]
MSISGKYLTAKIGTTVITDNYAWDAAEGGQMLGRTTGAFLGKRAEDFGVDELTIIIKGYMDVAAGAYTPVRRGTTITNLRLYRDESDSVPAYDVPVAKVANSRQGAEVEGKVEWQAEIHAYGGWTYNDPGA